MYFQYKLYKDVKYIVFVNPVEKVVIYSFTKCCSIFHKVEIMQGTL